MPFVIASDFVDFVDLFELLLLIGFYDLVVVIRLICCCWFPSLCFDVLLLIYFGFVVICWF